MPLMRHRQVHGANPGGGGVPGGRRTGVVRPDGRAVVDDNGPFYPLGLTFFWSMQGAKYEPQHYAENVNWSASKGFDFHRLLTEVAWAGNRRIDPTQPEWHDWAHWLRYVIDFPYERGIRAEVTLRGKGTSVDHLQLARDVGGIVADGRTHKVVLLEPENEYAVGGDPLEELVAMAGVLRQLTPNLVCLSCPEQTAAGAALMKSESLRAGVTAMTRHTERDPGDHGWRDVRQAYDFKNDRPLVGWDGEGPGPGSSGSVLTGPLQLAMKRAVAIMCGAPGFVLHTGTGVYGDGKPGGTGPRPPNFWEIPNIEAIVDAVRGIDALLPPGLPNWTVANTQWQDPLPVAPFQPHHHWEGDGEHDERTGAFNDGVNKAYGALGPDGQVIQMPCGVRGHAVMTASYQLREVTVYDPLARRAVPGFENRSFAKGDTMDLPGGPWHDPSVAYIIRGRR